MYIIQKYAISFDVGNALLLRQEKQYLLFQTY